ncbi:MAG: hypothetical protein PHX30_04955 [Candidatus Pacebacteria bacterium]|nr:hypothetical protein [Candidatus Paceibacterota bacterium]
MKKSYGKILTSFALAALSLFPFQTHAIGQVTEPIDIKNALREKPYNETIAITNTESSNSTIQLSAEGDIAGWTRFYKNAQDTDNITSIEVPAGSKINVIARFIVPAGIPNGSYQGFVSVSKKAGDFANDTENSGSSVSQKIDREVTVEVNDIENVAFDASIIPETYDLNQGQSLKIRVIYDNQGNVEITPQISLKIKQGDNTVYSAIFPYPDNQPKAGPYSLFEIPALEIPTSQLQNGKYDAVFTIAEGEKYSIDKDFRFSIGMVKAASTSAPSSTDYPLGVSQFTIVLATVFAIYLIFRPKIKDGIKKYREAAQKSET